MTTTYFDAGVLLRSATLSIGTSGFASGKYVAQLPRGMGKGTTRKRSAVRVSPRKWLVRSTRSPAASPREVTSSGAPVRQTRPTPQPLGAASAAGATVITTHFDVGVLLRSATLSIGTSGFASGK